jgi:predicted nucleic acid-binding protein
MSARSFFDINVLVYTDDKASPTKRRSALALVAEHRRSGSGVVSMQVLQEYFVKQLCKKLHILQKLSFLTTQTKGLASGAGWQSGMELCRARATSLKLR